MSIALLVESTTTENHAYQTLLVPTETDVLLFTRLFTNQRGRASHWSQVANDSQLPTEPITSEPVAVIINPREVASAEIGNITTLAVKALKQKGDPITEGRAHDEVVKELREYLFAGDSALFGYLKTGSPINANIKPIAVAEPVAFYPAVVTEPVAPVAPVSNVVPIQAPVAHAPITSMPEKPVELAKVPDKKWAETYIPHKVGNTPVFDILDVAMKQNQNVLIRGHAGSGKTMAVLAYASARDYRYYNISANVGLEPSHLFGAWTPTEQAGVFKWQDGPVTDLVRNGGVLLLNEIDFMPERITTVLFGLLDDRREIQLLENGGEVIKAHPNLLVVGDHNPNYRGSRPMNQAWRDRFAHKLEFDYDKAIERKLIPNPALLEVANKLREQAYKGEIDTPISTRGLISFIKNVDSLGLDYAISSYLNGFSDDEREAVKLVFDTNRTQITDGFKK